MQLLSHMLIQFKGREVEEERKGVEGGGKEWRGEGKEWRGEENDCGSMATALAKWLNSIIRAVKVEQSWTWYMQSHTYTLWIPTDMKYGHYKALSHDFDAFRKFQILCKYLYTGSIRWFHKNSIFIESFKSVRSTYRLSVQGRYIGIRCISKVSNLFETFIVYREDNWI